MNQAVWESGDPAPRRGLFADRPTGTDAMREMARRLRREAEMAGRAGQLDLAAKLADRARLLEQDVHHLEQPRN